MANYRNELFNITHVHGMNTDEVGVSLQWKERDDVIMHVGFEMLNDLAGGISIRDPASGLERPFWRVTGVGVLTDHTKPTPPGYLRRVAKAVAIDYIADTRNVTVVRPPSAHESAVNIEPTFARLVRTTDDRKDHIFRNDENTSLCGRQHAHGKMHTIEIPIDGEISDETDTEAYVLRQAGVDNESMCTRCRKKYASEIMAMIRGEKSASSD